MEFREKSKCNRENGHQMCNKIDIFISSYYISRLVTVLETIWNFRKSQSVTEFKKSDILLPSRLLYQTYHVTVSLPSRYHVGLFKLGLPEQITLWRN
jgi:hypothetical protein